jgi:hypothetical protein
VTLSALCEPASKYEVGTITEVKTHQADDGSTGITSYEVSVRVRNTVYVALYTPPLGTDAVKYAAGRELLVLIGKKTITYNDILGQSVELPILSQKPVSDAKQSK